MFPVSMFYGSLQAGRCPSMQVKTGLNLVSRLYITSIFQFVVKACFTLNRSHYTLRKQQLYETQRSKNPTLFNQMQPSFNLDTNQCLLLPVILHYIHSGDQTVMPSSLSIYLKMYHNVTPNYFELLVAGNHNVPWLLVWLDNCII